MEEADHANTGTGAEPAPLVGRVCATTLFIVVLLAFAWGLRANWTWFAAEARRHRAQDIASGYGRLGLRSWHDGSSEGFVSLLADQDGSAKASVSMSMKVAPTAATAR